MRFGCGRRASIDPDSEGRSTFSSADWFDHTPAMGRQGSPKEQVVMLAVIIAPLSSCGEDESSDRPLRDTANPEVSDAGIDADRPETSSDGWGADAAQSNVGVCDETPSPRGADRSIDRSVVGVKVVLTYGGRPVVFGEPFALPVGSLILTTFRFFASDFTLLTRGSQRYDLPDRGARRDLRGRHVPLWTQ
jgi:hypothetical protein